MPGMKGGSSLRPCGMPADMPVGCIHLVCEPHIQFLPCYTEHSEVGMADLALLDDKC